MTVLVTGGAGYIGSHTVRLLRSLGRQVVVLDSMEFGHRSAVVDAPLVIGEISDRALVGRIVAEHGVDACVHFAAYKNPGESMEQPERYFGNNVAGSFALLEGLRASGVRRFVFSSTCAVYGTPESAPVSESAPLGPESPYGESKRMVEQMLSWYGPCHGLDSVSLRYFNAAGASFDALIGEDWAVTLNLVPRAMKAALERGPKLQVYGSDYPTPDGTAIRDYIHVDDLADAHVKALEYLERGGATTAVNLGTGTGTSVLDVLQTFERVTGVKVPHEMVGRRAGDPIAIFADNTRARQVLGWVPAYGIEEILGSAFRWHSTHLDGYSD
jgi:UDP-glucose-4-epimerase GalE